MKVSLVMAQVSLRSAGVWAAVEGLGAALRDTGVDARVVGLTDPDGQSPTTSARLPVDLCRVVGPSSLGYAPTMVGAIVRGQPDLVHSQGLWMYPSRASLLWRKRTRRPSLISPQGMLHPWALQRGKRKKRFASLLFENAHLRGAACLHAVSEQEARAFRDCGLRNPVCVVPNGTDLLDVGVVDQGGDGLKTLLFLGRLTPKKGLRELLHGWARVRGFAERQGWRLKIAGWDENGHRSELERIIDRLTLSSSVTLVGPCFGQEKVETFRAAHAFILPSFSEGVPLALLEAWSHHLPTLMTEQCNLPEGFAAGAAIQIGPDTSSIQKGLEQLLSMSDAERRSMGAAGRALVVRHFTWRRIAATMRDVYTWVLGGGTPPACILMD